MTVTGWSFFMFGLASLALAILGVQKSSAKELDQRVVELLSTMTLEEKVRQMTQISLEIVAKDGLKSEDRVELDMNKLRTAILKYHVGSILNVGTSAHSVDHRNRIIIAISPGYRDWRTNCDGQIVGNQRHSHSFQPFLFD